MNELRARPLDGSIEWHELHPETQKLLSRRGLVKVSLFGALTLALAACGDDNDDGASSTAAPTTATGTKSLYERLGGSPAITAVIGDFVDNQVVPDTRINAFFATTDLTRLKILLVEFTGVATGGPEVYTGRDMKSSHAGLKIDVAAFNALVEDLSKSLDVFKVPATEKSELLGALAPLQADIVTV
jgi:hemoglobin